MVIFVTMLLVLFGVSTASPKQRKNSIKHSNEVDSSMTCDAICTSRECLRTAMNFLQNMDQTVNPCDDFYKFTCGNWAKHHFGPNLEETFDLYDEKYTEVLKFIRIFLKSKEKREEPKIIKQTRNMYKSCMTAGIISKNYTKSEFAKKSSNLYESEIQQKNLLDGWNAHRLDYLHLFHLAKFPTIIVDTITNLTSNITGRHTISDKTAQTIFKKIESETEFKFDWVDVIAEIQRIIAVDIFFRFEILPDSTNRNRIFFGAPESFGETERNKIISKMTKLINFSFKNNELKQFRKMFHPFIIKFADKITGITQSLQALADKAVADDNEIIKQEESELEYEDEDEDEDEDENVTESDNGTTEYVTDNNTYEYVTENSTFGYVTGNSTYEYVTESDEDIGNDDEDTEDEDGSDNDDRDFYSLNIEDFQNATYVYLVENTTTPFNEIPQFFHQYFTTIFKEVTDPPIDVTQHEIQSSRADFFYVQYLIEYILSMPTVDIELYIWWTLVEHMASSLDDIRNLRAEYDLDGITLRSRTCILIVQKTMNRVIDYAMAQTSVFKITKPKVETMLNNIRTAFDDSVYKMEWIDDETKQTILNKSHAMKTLVGVPEWILEHGKLDEYYGNLTFTKTSYLSNLIKFLNWQTNKNLQKLNATETIDFDVEPSEVNAYNVQAENAMTITLAYLQYPFYDLGLEALNYGATGATIGHELIHSFDDSGRLYDENGNEAETWTDDTTEEFINKTECFVKQFNTFFKDINKHVNGKVTLDENIADNGGLHQAYYAYKTYVENEGKEKLLPGFDRFSHEQLFFISYGSTECKTQTKSSLSNQLKYDAHSPSQFRVNGVLQNSIEFANVFNCAVNSKMVSKAPCRIW